jgi:putative spermidine/putrescine transport system permease protein
MSSARSGHRLGLAVFLLLTVAPVGAGLGYASLYSVGLAGLLSHGFTLEHWARVAASGEARWSLGLSVAVAAAVTALATGLALPLALVLRRRLQRGLLADVVSLPLALPGTVMGLLVFQFLGGAGLVSRIAWRLGLTRDMSDFPAAVHDPLAAGIVLAHTGLAVPFLALLLAELHHSQRVEAFSEVAESLGAGRLDILRRVALPLLLRGALPSLALLFVVVLGSYEIPLLLGRQSPQMISVLVMRRFALFDITQKPEAFILALVYAALVLGLVGLAFGRRAPAA